MRWCGAFDFGAHEEGVADGGLAQPHPAAAGFDTVVNDLWTSVSDFIDDLIEPLTGPIVQSVTRPSSPATLQTEARFWQYLSDSGYEVVSIETDVGVIPNLKVTMQIVRELSEADHLAVIRALEIDDHRDPGLMAMMQRAIVRSLLEVSQSGDMRASKLLITLLPLPSIAFTMTPAEGPLSAQSQTGAAKPVKGKPAAEPQQSCKTEPQPVGQ